MRYLTNGLCLSRNVTAGKKSIVRIFCSRLLIAMSVSLKFETLPTIFYAIAVLNPDRSKNYTSPCEKVKAGNCLESLSNRVNTTGYIEVTEVNYVDRL